MQMHDTHDPTPAARTAGALATRLTAALDRARGALEPHAGLLAPDALADLAAELAEFSRRRVRIAVYGEVKAGKSTLLNAIAGAQLSPVAFEPLTSIPVRVTYGEGTAWRVGARQLDSIDAVERLMRDGNGTAPAEVLVETDLDLLQLGGQVDLLDTPGVGSAEQFDAITGATVRALDAVVLVVRYPALFTQYTRRLMEALQADIGKLFVVWNLDADCAELRPDERTRHAETLRANVAGAHELFLVDARAGLRAMQGDDAEGSVASGLSALIASLRRFAASDGRAIASLRETAKRGERWLVDAQQRLSERHAALDRLLTDTRGRLRAVQEAADAEAGAARSRLADFEAAVGRIGDAATARATQRAADVGRQLRRARRAWVRRADLAALETQVNAARAQYADAVEAVTREARQALLAEAATFGAAAELTPRDRRVPTVEALTPPERQTRAATGGVQWLRRALWHRWYLPGLASLEQDIAADREATAAWTDAARRSVTAAAAAVLESRLADIAQQATVASDAIKQETEFSACAEECRRLEEHLPVIDAQRAAVAQVASEARALL